MKFLKYSLIIYFLIVINNIFSSTIRSNLEVDGDISTKKNLYLNSDGTTSETAIIQVTNQYNAPKIRWNGSLGVWQCTSNGTIWNNFGLPLGTSGQTLRYDGTNWIANSILFNNGVNVGVNTSNPSEKLDVNGNIKCDTVRVDFISDKNGDNTSSPTQIASAISNSHSSYLIGTKLIDETGIDTGKVLKFDSTENKWKMMPDVGGEPYGSSKTIQYNDNGKFGGDDNLTWDSSIAELRIKNTNVSSKPQIILKDETEGNPYPNSYGQVVQNNEDLNIYSSDGGILFIPNSNYKVRVESALRVDRQIEQDQVGYYNLFRSPLGVGNKFASDFSVYPVEVLEVDGNVQCDTVKIDFISDKNGDNTSSPTQIVNAISNSHSSYLIGTKLIDETGIDTGLILKYNSVEGKWKIGNDLVGITEETDPIFSAWDKSTGITIGINQVTNLQAELDGKVDSDSQTYQDVVSNSHSSYQIGTKLIDETGIDTGKVLKFDSTENKWKIGNDLEGAYTFLELTDTPSSYTGQSNKVPIVKSTEDSLEFSLISTNNIADNSITETKLQDNSVTTSKIQDGAVTETDISDNAVTTNKIQNNAVTLEKLAVNSVNSSKIVDGTIVDTDINSNASISLTKLERYPFTTQDIQDSAITSIKIADGAVTETDIANNSVSSSKIIDGAVGTDDLGDGVVTSSKIQDYTITETDISDSAKILKTNEPLTLPTILGNSGKFLKTDGSGLIWDVPAGDITGSGTAGKLVKFTDTKVIGDATNTDTEVSDAVSKAHTQNTDTILTTDGSTQLINAGTLKSNLAVDTGITIDGIDISDKIDQAVKTTSSPTFQLVNTASGSNTGILLGSLVNSYGGRLIRYSDQSILLGLTGNTSSYHFLITQSDGTNIMCFNGDGNIGIGTSVLGTSAYRVLGFINGTAPSTSPADTVQLYANDATAGKSVLHIRNEDGTVYNTWMSGARAYRSLGASVQTIPTGTWTIVQFNAETFDIQNEYDNTTNFRFTATKAGYYQVNASVMWSSWNTSSVFYVSIYKNAAEYARNYFVAPSASGGSVPVSDIVYLSTGDYIDVRVYQNTGVDKTIEPGNAYTYFSIIKVF